MPLVLEDEARNGPGGGGFDLQTAQTLFWRPVPVLLRQAEREDQFEELTFRILTGVARNNHNMRILRVHISSDSDLYFLHSLEVSEEDFQSLKNEQGILVDFASFPGKIITLLDKCISPQPTDAPRFQAVLTVRGSESLFKIVETNDFKQLPHITLAFRPGNDSAVKQFLAFRLLEVKGNVQELTAELDKTKSDRDTASTQLASTKAQLSDLKDQYDKHLMEVQAESKMVRAAAHEEKLKEKAEMKAAHEREVAELQRRTQEQVDALVSRAAELDGENRKLREAKYELDTKVSELSHRLGTAEGTNRSLEEECTRLRAANTALAREKHERDMAANEFKARLVAVDEKASAQVEIIEQQKSRIRDLEASVRGLEGRCTDLRDAVAGHDQRTKDAQAEVLKGNQIIEKLMNDLKLSKEKVKRKQAIIVRQEEELQARDNALAGSQRELQGLNAAVESLRAEVGGLRSENAELKAKLEDSKAQLQSNEQMIRWLNQQVTEAQLGTAGAVPGSRYSFRPALPSATPSMGGAGAGGMSSSSALVATGSVSSALPAPQGLGANATPGVGLQGSSAIGSHSHSSIAAKYTSSLGGGATGGMGAGMGGGYGGPAAGLSKGYATPASPSRLMPFGAGSEAGMGGIGVTPAPSANRFMR